jgi:CHAD domain-containing protein
MADTTHQPDLRRGWPEIALDRQGPALTGYRAVLRADADALDDHWAGALLGDDAEELHDLRVVIRRSRTLLEQGRRVLPRPVRRDLAAGFSVLAAATGTARDLDVHLDGWSVLTASASDDEVVALAPVRAELEARREAGHAELARHLSGPEAAALRTDLRRWLELPDHETPGGREARDPLGVVAADRLRRAHRSVQRRGRRIGPDSPADDLHRLRKDAKRLRYLLESFGDLGGRKRNRRVVAHLKRLQDNLGEHQDTGVQAERLRVTVDALAGDGRLTPATATAVERLTARLDVRQAAARAEFAHRFAAYGAADVQRVHRELQARMTR